MTLVAERMIRAWAPATASSSSSGRELELDVDVVAGGPEAVEPAVGDLLGHQDAGHGAEVWSAPPGPANRIGRDRASGPRARGD